MIFVLFAVLIAAAFWLMPPESAKGWKRTRLLQWLHTRGHVLPQCHPIRISFALKNPDRYDWS